MEFLPPSAFLSSIPNPVGEQKVLAEKVLGKVIKLEIISTETVCRSYATNTCKLVHVLRSKSAIHFHL